MKRIQLAALCLVALSVPALASDDIDVATLAAGKHDVLTDAEIKSLVSGKVFTDTSSAGSARRIELSNDGSLSGRSQLMGAKGIGKTGEGRGKWHVDGGKLCLDIEWKTSAEKWCRPVWKAEGKHYLISGSKETRKARMFGVE